MHNLQRLLASPVADDRWRGCCRQDQTRSTRCQPEVWPELWCAGWPDLASPPPWRSCHLAKHYTLRHSHVKYSLLFWWELARLWVMRGETGWPGWPPGPPGLRKLTGPEFGRKLEPETRPAIPGPYWNMDNHPTLNTADHTDWENLSPISMVQYFHKDILALIREWYIPGIPAHLTMVLEQRRLWIQNQKILWQRLKCSLSPGRRSPSRPPRGWRGCWTAACSGVRSSRAGR